jgi:hypothetical protein
MLTVSAFRSTGADAGSMTSVLLPSGLTFKMSFGFLVKRARPGERFRSRLSAEGTGIKNTFPSPSHTTGGIQARWPSFEKDTSRDVVSGKTAD